MTEKTADTVEPSNTDDSRSSESDPNAHGSFGILSVRDYRLLVLSNFATFAGYQIRNMAQAWFVLERTNSATLMGLVNAMPGIAIISISLIGGALADRTERWQLLWRTKAIIASMSLLTAVLLTTDVLEWWHLIPISLLTGSMFALHNPTSQAFAVDVVGRERLVSASSLNTGISMIATIAGPSVGGALLLLGYDTAFYVLTGLYAFSAFMIFRVRTRRVPVPSSRNMFNDIREGIGYAYRTPIIRALLMVGMGALFMGMNQPAIPVKVQDELGLGEVGYGIMLGLNGVGSLIGAVVLFAFAKHVRKGYLLIFALLVFNGSIGIFAIAPNVLISGLAMTLMGLAFASWMISVPVLLQTTASENMRGRVMSLYFMTVLTHQLGWLIGGAGIEAFGIQTTLFIGIAGGLAVAGTSIVLTPALAKAR
ncbi:MAG TPA: MFS transporter [Dehalococcoidia bacterium]|jgi:MFS family permease|nr:MFS transporter [Dehalococcoidia bacterium]MDP7484456.1 MFS transporter [Dehalococcoidia bacterium]HJP27994.1 MFS transporter [Dehalococcoidia bacterium]|tara:strand:- start:6658 stop:7929 length:1272 start_codon:yes stop_codon:yes gene_type:complete